MTTYIVNTLCGSRNFSQRGGNRCALNFPFCHCPTLHTLSLACQLSRKLYLFFSQASTLLIHFTTPLFLRVVLGWVPAYPHLSFIVTFCGMCPFFYLEHMYHGHHLGGKLFHLYQNSYTYFSLFSPFHLNMPSASLMLHYLTFYNWDVTCFTAK